jgi:hypothetical protein
MSKKVHAPSSLLIQGDAFSMVRKAEVLLIVSTSMPHWSLWSRTSQATSVILRIQFQYMDNWLDFPLNYTDVTV